MLPGPPGGGDHVAAPWFLGPLEGVNADIGNFRWLGAHVSNRGPLPVLANWALRGAEGPPLLSCWKMALSYDEGATLLGLRCQAKPIDLPRPWVAVTEKVPGGWG